MENYVSAQLLLLGQAALLGMLGGVVYDLLRPLRRGRLIHLTDALFTGGGLVLMVWFLTAVSRGEARLFFAAGRLRRSGAVFSAAGAAAAAAVGLLGRRCRRLWTAAGTSAALWCKVGEKNREFPEKTLSFFGKNTLQ
ncbi:MAG: hypothetical protein ACLTLK_12265 [Oscillospiraceae bacterium]